MVEKRAHIHHRNFLLHIKERADYDGLVLLKEPVHEQPSRDHLDQLHNEFAITTQMAGLSGVRPAYAMEGTESHPVLLLEYIPGQSLAELILSSSLDLAEKLRLAMNVAKVLSRIHEQQVMHKSLDSGNILVATNDRPGSQNGVYIIDFGLASTLLQENPSRIAPDEILAGTLAYISPEQTRRMNHRVDYRTDFYSLGVVLYELFTGQLPFESDDALEMIHAHIARQPQPPQQIDAGIPGPVSEVILKLLAKNAEDRYQTAYGLQADLKRCLDQWQSKGRIEPFELRGDDFTGRLQIPEKLYGRQAEIEQLQTIFGRAITEQPQLLLVAGYSGVGKTSLVHEIQKDIIVKQGIFIEGKFDQLQRTLPYSAWAQAFTKLVDNLLAESETSLAGWRESILEALGNNGQILIDIIPALESIIGPQPEVPQLGGIENQNRFNYYFNRFISELATFQHPLVVFLDDMQWIDPASLNLIEALLAEQETSYFMVIGAYRSNEVDLAHPLAVSLKRMQAESNQVTVIKWGDLSSDDTNHLLADTLQLSVPDCRDLDKILVKKSGGNPFFYRQLLYTLEADGLLKFDVEGYHWRWVNNLDLNLQARGSVVDLMIKKIRALPVETQRALSLAACIGSRFDTSTLDIITGQKRTELLSDLNPAIQEGLIIRSDGYLSFTHDRIQEAGYALIPQSDLPQTHLEIGRTLREDAPADDLEEGIFAIVGHLNTGREFIDRDSEKLELANLNLKAGQKAKAAAAYSDAKKYIEIGLELLGRDTWQDQYELTLSLHNENGELAYLTGQFDQVSPTVDLIQRNAKTIYDQMRIYMTQIEAETAQYNVVEALDMGLEVLRILGFEIPSQPTAEDIHRLKDKFIGLLSRNPPEQIVRFPQMLDERALAASSILASIMSTSYIINPPLFPIISYNGAILILEYGLDVWAPFFFGGVTLVNFASVDREAPVDEMLNLIRFYKQLVGVIRELLDNPVTARSRSKSLMMLAFTTPWIGPIEKSIEFAQDTFSSGYETGDWLYASYGTVFYSVLGFDAEVNLGTYESQLSVYVHNIHRLGYLTPAYEASIFFQTALNFMKISPEPHRLAGTFLNEDEWLPSAITANDIASRHYFYISKLILVYHFDVVEKLDEYAGNAEDFLNGGQGMYSTALFYLYFALTRLRLVGRNSPNKDPEIMNLINQSLNWMAIWSGSAPSTFQHKYDLIAAEKARVMGDLDGALTHYEQAIAGARENRFTHEEALANELYARFWAERGNDRFAGLLMREAYSLYSKWGALAKAEHLARRYPDWLIGRGIFTDDPQTQTTTDQIPVDLDLLTVLKASQDIASEIALNSLLAKLMTHILENSGAQQAYLLLEQERQWTIVAQADVDELEPQVEKSIPIAESDLLAQGIVHYVARRQETVVLEDASQSGEFTQDPYVRSHQARSILCTPLINQRKTSAILYLKNDLATQVFSSQRVNLLQLLSSQMAISIDNARIHDNLEAMVTERTRELQAANQAKSLFFASMSHELRSPLNAILGYTRLVARDENLNTQQQERLKIVNRSGEHLLDMISDILSLSRIEARRVGLSEERFDFRQILEDIGRIFRSRAEGKGLGFSLELADDLPSYLRGDAGKLRQVLFNLLDNAVKFTQKGAVCLRARPQTLEKDSGRVLLQLEVEDSGLGIPPDHVDEIFETFVRYEPVQQTQPGTGLGLSISRSLLEMMGGQIAVESEVGRGSLFKVNIPMQLVDGAAAMPDEPAATEVVGLQPGQPEWRILVVDDYRENLLLLSDLLTQAGFIVNGAENGADAVTLFQDWRPHFIWMDVRMPVMDGYQATKQIRALPGGDTVKIVAVTASVIDDLQDVGHDSGIDDVVLKPFLDQEIFEVMAQELGVEYVYRDREEALKQPVGVALSVEMLADLPPDLLRELSQTTFVADREATLAVIERIEDHAPETAASLRALLDNFQMVRLRDLVKEADSNNA